MEETMDQGSSKAGLGSIMGKRKASDFFQDEGIDEDESNREEIKEPVVKTRKSRFDQGIPNNTTLIPSMTAEENRKIEESKRLIAEMNSKAKKSVNTELIKAIEDENVYSIETVYPSSKKSETANTMKFSKIKTDVNKYDESIPIYKRLAAGDEVMAKYSEDGQYYPAVIKTLIHKGYASAKYDVKFHNYDTIETVGWQELYLREIQSEIQTEIQTKNENMDAFGRDITIKKKIEPSTITQSKWALIDQLKSQRKDYVSIFTSATNSLGYIMKSDDFVNTNTILSLQNAWK